MVKMFYNSNIFVIVGSPNNQELNKKEILIWDDKNGKKIFKLLIKKEILNLELTLDKIIVVCNNIIYIFNSKSFQLIDIIKTGQNPKGLIGVSYKERNIIVYPSESSEHGKLTIKDYDNNNYIYLNPHEHSVTHISLSYNGVFLATSSQEGKKIRIFEVKTGRFLDELHRDESGIIKFISINKKNNYISVSGEKGPIPIWALKKAKKLIGEEIEEFDKVTNIHGGLITDKEKGFNHVNLKKYKDPIFEAVKPGDQNILYIITSNGIFFNIRFENEKKTKKNEGNFEVLEYENLFSE